MKLKEKIEKIAKNYDECERGGTSRGDIDEELAEEIVDGIKKEILKKRPKDKVKERKLPTKSKIYICSKCNCPFPNKKYDPKGYKDIKFCGYCGGKIVYKTIKGMTWRYDPDANGFNQSNKKWINIIKEF